jgi:hypothetical protein
MECCGKRLNIITRFNALPVQPGWETEWPILTNLATWLLLKHITPRAPIPPELPDQEVLADLLKQLDKVSRSPDLEYLGSA